MNVILLTTCPGGSVTSYLAAQRLTPAAEAKDWQLSTEVHSSLAPVGTLSHQTLAAAELVIAVGEPIAGAHRFSGKRLYRGSLEDALSDPSDFLERAARDAQVFTPLNDEAASASGNGPVAADGSDEARIVAVTACPTGVAHTFMAAEALAEAGRGLGHQVRVETQGSVGAQDQLTDDEIAQADLVILACDIEVDPTRFAGKRI